MLRVHKKFASNESINSQILSLVNTDVNEIKTNVSTMDTSNKNALNDINNKLDELNEQILIVKEMIIEHDLKE
tara:strand:+ start:13169 stop:13387 length:219 start_codon:yes stop_codon:yes gene_type:complete